MHVVYLSIGSNLGDRHAILQNALKSISEEIGNVLAVSSFYESEPFGFVADEKFLNACIKLETEQEPLELLASLHTIESKNGRIRQQSTAYISRTLDLDILFFNDWIIELDQLQIPHKHFHNRQFVLRPLNDIASNLIDPLTFLTINQHLQNCKDASDLTKYKM